jgi:hypothetical protein
MPHEHYSKTQVKMRMRQLLSYFIVEYDHIADNADEPLEADLMQGLNAMRANAAVLFDELKHN